MSCPHCQGEIPPNSQFCGICGNNIAPPVDDQSATFFDIPVSKGAKRIRIAIILAFNLAMVGGGIALLLGYLHKRDAASLALPGAEDRTVAGVDSSSIEGSESSGEDMGSPVSEKTQENPALRTQSQSPQKQRPSSTPRTPDSTSRKEGTTERPSADPKTDPAQTIDSGSQQAKEPVTPTTLVADGGTAVLPPRKIDAGSETNSLTPEEEAKRVRIVASKISRVVASHSGQLGRCYQNAQKITTPDNPVEGVVKVGFTIQSDGSATSVSVRSNSTDSASLGKCVSSLVKSWNFPASPGPPLDFEWPFEFQAPK